METYGISFIGTRFIHVAAIDHTLDVAWPGTAPSVGVLITSQSHRLAQAASMAAEAKHGDEDRWSEMINSASKSVVVMKMLVRHAIEPGTQAYASEGTGFVVDADKGLILTNRCVELDVYTAFMVCLQKQGSFAGCIRGSAESFAASNAFRVRKLLDGAPRAQTHRHDWCYLTVCSNW